jgi:hypothetical protein
MRDSANRSEPRAALHTRFDITTKVRDGATNELPIYALLTAKNGPKVKATADDGSGGKQPDEQLATTVKGKDGFPALAPRSPGLVIETKSGRARVTAKETPISKFADLTGNYSFVVYFTPEAFTPEAGTPRLCPYGSPAGSMVWTLWGELTGKTYGESLWGELCAKRLRLIGYFGTARAAETPADRSTKRS